MTADAPRAKTADRAQVRSLYLSNIVVFGRLYESKEYKYSLVCVYSFGGTSPSLYALNRIYDKDFSRLISSLSCAASAAESLSTEAVASGPRTVDPP